MALEARIDRLEDALGRLAEAQARTEAVVQALAEAQARTEERVGRLEERMDRVEVALARLAEAQARTEERVGRLEEGQRELQVVVARLAEAQARTEAQVRSLAEAQARTEAAVQTLAQQVGRLTETIGFTLEDLAREVTLAYLAQHYGIQGLKLDRRFFVVEGQELEVDFYGEGRQDGEVVAVVGEVRSRIHGRDVEAAVRQAMRLAPQLPGTPLPVLFGFVIHPSAREVASRLGALVISSSGR